jgi:uncharacterized protein YuzE
MKINYDPKVDAVYIDLAKGRYEVSREISDSIVVDEDKKGKVLGIEILDASKNISAFDPKNTKFTVQSA